jgi:hypothetical protein
LSGQKEDIIFNVNKFKSYVRKNVITV